MTLRLLLGCNLVSLRGIRLITLLWRVAVVVVGMVVVAVEQVGYLHRLHLYLLALHTQLLSVAAALALHPVLPEQVVLVLF
jgi:hypothetical protein